MKNQALFSSKDKSKKLKCCLLQILFGTLRVKKNLLLLEQFLFLTQNLLPAKASMSKFFQQICGPDFQTL